MCFPKDKNDKQNEDLYDIELNEKNTRNLKPHCPNALNENAKDYKRKR